MQNTYDARANYLAGISYWKKGDFVNALESLGWAARSIEYRSTAYAQMAEIYVRLTSYEKAIEYAQKSLDYNKYNITAREVKITASRLVGKETDELIRELQEIDPLNHQSRYEEYKLESSNNKKENFIKHITNEFPEETYLELALFYHSLGMTKDAIDILSTSTECVKNDLWLAYLNRIINPNLSDELLSKSIAASPEFVFPYRLESLEMLEWARKQKSSWKLDYYSAIALAGVGRRNEAVDLLLSLENQPDFWVFYMTRAGLIGKSNVEQSKIDLVKANELAPESWRTWDKLIQFYLANNEYLLAVGLSKKATSKFPKSYTLSFLHAKSLLKTGSYQQCINILKNIQILPFEGATVSRNVYEEAHIRLALELIEKKKYKSSVKVLQESMEWPENIGVGKPYDPEQRKAEYLLAYCYDKLGDKSMGDEQLKNIVDYTNKMIARSTPDHLLGLLALKESGKEDEGDALLSKINSNTEFNSEVKQWINDQYKNVGSGADEAKYSLLIQIANL